MRVMLWALGAEVILMIGLAAALVDGRGPAELGLTAPLGVRVVVAGTFVVYLVGRYAEVTTALRERRDS